MKKCYVSSSVIFRFFISAILFLGALFINDYILLAVTLMMNFYCIYTYRHNSIVFFLLAFITFCNYSIYAYYWMGLCGTAIEESYIKWLQYPNVLRIGLVILYVFSATLFCFLPMHDKIDENCYFETKDLKRNPFMGMVFLLGIVMILGISMYLTYHSGIYKESSIYQYTIILYILVLYHFGKNKPITYFLLGVMVIDILFILMNGDRGHALQLMLLIYCVFLHDKLPKWVLFIILIVGMIIMNSIGMWRGYGTFSLDFLIDSVTSLGERKFVLDTAYAAEGLGLGMIYLADMYGLWGRLRLFTIYIASVFVGSGVFSSEANLAALVINEGLYSCGGGTLPSYGYFYLGYAGVLLLGILVCIYIGFMLKDPKESTGLKQCICVYIFSTMTDWYLYSPAPLIRGIMLLSILYFVSTKVRI